MALQENNVLTNEHFVKEVLDKALVKLSKRSTHHKEEPRKPVSLERHVIDLQA